MMLECRFARAVAVLALALIAGACGKKAESRSTDEVPEVSADVPDVAGGSTAANADLRELSRYQLTMADVNKWAAAIQNMKRLLDQHPEWASEDDKHGSSGDQSLDEIEANLEAVPPLRKAVEDAGLNAREYAVITFALMQASMGRYAVQQGANADSFARAAGIHPANLQFAKEHEAEITRLARLMQ